MTHKNYPMLFSEGRIGSLKITNRVIMAPMAMNYAGSDGSVTPEVIHYYVERAIGEVGLIIVENCNVDSPLGHNGAVQLRLDKDNFIPGLARLREAMNDANPDVKVALQINHAGGQTISARIEGHQVVAPSNVPTRIGGEIPRALTIAEIIIIQEKFAQTAQRAQLAGFDAIEIHGGFGYLIAQFLSAVCNHRTDQYGGSLENRVRFAIEIIQKIREKIGKNFPILFRLNGNEFTPGGVTTEDAIVYAKLLEAASVDLLHVSAGSGFRPTRHIEPMSYPQGAKVDIAYAIKQVVSIPVAAVGVIREPDFAEHILASNKADFIALGRTLIADPHWVKKVRENRAFTHCISCNECARLRIFAGLPVRCSVNPTVGNEHLEQKRNRNITPHRILIIGGGPAGLKAAIEARYDGHDVTLWERQNILGGRALTAAVPPHKEKIHWMISDLVNEIERLGVKIKLNCNADLVAISQYQPDFLIVAIGSVDTLPNWLDEKSCELADNTLKTPVVLGDRKTVIIGGGSMGCELAEYLAQAGQRVTILEMQNQVAHDLDPISRQELLERMHNIQILTNSQVIATAGKTVTYKHKGQTIQLITDAIVYAGGLRQEESLLKEIALLKERVPTYIIGDSRLAGRFVDAVRHAYRAIHDIRMRLNFSPDTNEIREG